MTRVLEQHELLTGLREHNTHQLYTTSHQKFADSANDRRNPPTRPASDIGQP